MARNRLVEQNEHLAEITVAYFMRTMPAGVERDELLSAAHWGLILAADRYDPGRGTAFRTWAILHIRIAIRDYLRSTDPIPRSVRDFMHRHDLAEIALRERGIDKPCAWQIAAELQIPEKRLLEMRRVYARAFTADLFDPLEEEADRDERYEERKNTAEVPVELLAHARLQRRQLLWAIGTLPKSERWVVEQYFYGGKSRGELAALKGVSETRIYQLLERALKRLKGALLLDEKLFAEEEPE